MYTILTIKIRIWQLNEPQEQPKNQNFITTHKNLKLKFKEYPEKKHKWKQAWSTCKSPETSTSLMVVREERYLSAPKEASGRIAYCKTLSVRSISESSLLICLATIFTLLGLAMHLMVEPILGCKKSRPMGLAEWIQAVGYWVLRNGGWGWEKSGSGGIGGWWW